MVREHVKDAYDVVGVVGTAIFTISSPSQVAHCPLFKPGEEAQTRQHIVHQRDDYVLSMYSQQQARVRRTSVTQGVGQMPQCILQ